MTSTVKAAILALAALIPLSSCVRDAGQMAIKGVTDAMLVAAPADEWLSHGRDYGEQRFSPLTAINDANVGQLGLAWSADLDTARPQEATPLMHDGLLFVSTAWSMVKAYDAKTGRLVWAHDPKVPRETLIRTCCNAVNRGVALYGDKLYIGSLDGRLIALDQKSGKVVWSRVVVPNQKDYTITGAPRIANGKVFLGSAGAEFKARGYIAAYDTQTGRELWKFHTVPGDPARGFENPAMKKAAPTWAGQWWKLGGGGTVWDSIVYDPATNLVLFGTGNAEPWNPGDANREGDSLYTASIVAVNADTGAYAWHFQETPEDRWDFDSNAQITVADLDVGGQRRHVALHAPKNGYFYMLDAKTGAFISAGPFVQQNWTTGIDPKTGQAKINPQARYEKTGQTFVSMPGAGGAHNWHPMSFSPKTGLVYLPVSGSGAFPYTAAKDWKPDDIGWQIGLEFGSLGGTRPQPARAAAPAAPAASSRLTGTPPPGNALVAWDPVAQKEVWRFAQSGGGGTLATAGNLVFQGNSQGAFNAYSADKGSRLWSFPVQTGVVAAPMTYAIDGVQYVAILVGAGSASNNISRMLVFKLGASGQLPPPPPAVARVLDPPPFTGTPEQVARGSAVYSRYCAFCHGPAAIANLADNPDLRHSAMLNDVNAMKVVLLDGALKHNGMVSFKSVVSPSDVEALRQYLLQRANQDKPAGARR